jgi:hypothetical protein
MSIPRSAGLGRHTGTKMTGAHDHGAARLTVSWRVHRLLTVVALGLAIATLIGVVVLWPGRDVSSLGSKLGLSSPVYDATVVHSTHGPCGGTGRSLS